MKNYKNFYDFQQISQKLSTINEPFPDISQKEQFEDFIIKNFNDFQFFHINDSLNDKNYYPIKIEKEIEYIRNKKSKKKK